MAAPGVVVSTATRSGPTGTVQAPSGQYFVTGLTERGPIGAPVRVNSMADYRRIFGDRVSYGAVYDDLTMFFEVGGAQAWVQRIVGAASAAGFLAVDDGSSVPTLRFEAASPGAWSSRLSVLIGAGAGGTGTRSVQVLLDGDVVESYSSLDGLAAIVSRFATSPYVRVTNLGSATAAPGNLPATMTEPEELSAGADDRASVSAATVADGLASFKEGLGDGAVAAPGFGQTVHAALIEHTRSTRRRIAILSAARTATRDDLIALGRDTGIIAGSEAAGLFGPWVQVSDGAGGVRTVSPEGYVAAARNRAHELYGPWAPAAGENSVSPYIVGLDVDFDRADAEALDAARVSPIRVVAGRIRLYGWRSLSPNEVDFQSLSTADVLARLVTECEARLEPFVFTPVDGRRQVLAKMQGVLIGILEPMRAAGGLFESIDPVTGDVLDPGYSVDVSASQNTVESLQQNRVNISVAARPSPNASLVNLTIVKVGLTAGV